MKRLLTPLVVVAAVLVLTTLPAMAQTAPAPPPASVVPGPGLVGPPAARIPSAEQARPAEPIEKQIDGPVKKVDPLAKTVQVGWFLGLFRTTLEVTDNTDIAVGGAKASLQDIREGDEVKASYETRDGQDIAKTIEATHPEATGGAGTPSTGPGSLTAPQRMELREPPAPPAGGAKTP